MDSGDSDDQSEEEVVLRDATDFDYERFDPVLIRGQQHLYPGEISPEIREYLGDPPGQYSAMTLACGLILDFSRSTRNLTNSA